ncbi:P2Y purinoceptor 2-like [Megalops cyprinoides]|uniref:P2Y purinoceptor 2-like n=1 Tax=Megalops cyprinoides TaxID=118141 RepID=UPI001864FA16|nr:P2Y purinoceptor 2-like [Megalops cyprinoides]
MMAEIWPSLLNGTECLTLKLHTAIPSFLSIFYLCGFLLNSLSLWIFASQRRKWNSGMVLQFNLALSDVLVTPATPFLVLYSLWDDWPFGRFLCQLKVFLLSVHVYGGICFLTLISVHRCSTVARHQGASKSRMANPGYVQRLCAGVWVGLLLQGLPFFGLLDVWRDRENSTKCLSFHQRNMAPLFFFYNLSILVVGVLLPLFVFVACYVWLSSFLSRMTAQGTQGRAMKAHSARVIAACLCIFILCYVPLHITRTMGVTVALFHPGECPFLARVELSYYISFTLSSANCCLDPLLYCFSSRRFRATLWQKLKRVRQVCSLCHARQREPEPGDNTDEPISTVNTTDRVT